MHQTARAKIRGHYEVRCYDRHGVLKWTDEIKNLITNVGLDHTLDTELSGGTPVTTWYVGLTDGTPTVDATDTMASHAGWLEIGTSSGDAYDETVRQTWTDAGVSSQSVTNSASKATFTMNDTKTVGGAFLVSDSAKGGTAGTLFSVGAFTGGDKSVVSADTLQVTATFTAADS